MSLECDKKLFVPPEEKIKKRGLVGNSVALRNFLCDLSISGTHELQNLGHSGIPGFFPSWNTNEHPSDIGEK